MLFKISSLITAAWFCFMTYLSHQNGTETDKTSGKLAEQLGQLLRAEDFTRLHGCLRQYAHVVLFAVFAVLLLFTVSLRWHDAKMLLGAGAFLVLWTWLDEATKPLITGRHFGWYDVGLNLLGVLIGGTIFTIYWLIRCSR